eukprot:SAG22_NODE_13903_length_391_cov_0.811644_1_plen_73_part_00
MLVNRRSALVEVDNAGTAKLHGIVAKLAEEGSGGGAAAGTAAGAGGDVPAGGAAATAAAAGAPPPRWRATAS